MCSQEIDEGDQAILDSYMPQGQLEGGRTLADLIMEKIDAQEGAADAPARESYLSDINQADLIFVVDSDCS